MHLKKKYKNFYRNKTQFGKCKILLYLYMKRSFYQTIYVFLPNDHSLEICNFQFFYSSKQIFVDVFFNFIIYIRLKYIDKNWLKKYS